MSSKESSDQNKPNVLIIIIIVLIVLLIVIPICINCYTQNKYRYYVPDKTYKIRSNYKPSKNTSEKETSAPKKESSEKDSSEKEQDKEEKSEPVKEEKSEPVKEEKSEPVKKETSEEKVSEEKPNIKIDDLDVNMHVDKRVNVFEQKTRKLPINHRYVVKNNKPIGVRSYPGYYDPYDHSITNVVYPDPLYPYSHSYNYNRFLQHKYLDENRKLHNKLDILEDKIKHHHNHHNHNHHKPHTVNNYYNSPKELIKQTKQTSKAPIAKSSELSSEVILKIPSEQPSKIMNESLPEISTEPSVETPVEEESR